MSRTLPPKYTHEVYFALAQKYTTNHAELLRRKHLLKGVIEDFAKVNVFIDSDGRILPPTPDDMDVISRIDNRSRLYLVAHGSSKRALTVSAELEDARNLDTLKRTVDVAELANYFARYLDKSRLHIPTAANAIAATGQKLRISMLVCENGIGGDGSVGTSMAVSFHHFMWKVHGISCEIVGRRGKVAYRFADPDSIAQKELPTLVLKRVVDRKNAWLKDYRTKFIVTDHGGESVFYYKNDENPYSYLKNYILPRWRQYLFKLRDDNQVKLLQDYIAELQNLAQAMLQGMLASPERPQAKQPQLPEAGVVFSVAHRFIDKQLLKHVAGVLAKAAADQKLKPSGFFSKLLSTNDLCMMIQQDSERWVGLSHQWIKGTFLLQE